MTRQSIREYARAIRDRYRQSGKEGKTKILDEFTKTTGLYRKAAIWLLNKDPLREVLAWALANICSDAEFKTAAAGDFFISH